MRTLIDRSIRRPGARPGHRTGAVALALGLALALALPVTLSAQQHDTVDHEHANGHSHGLHFTHPLIAESVSPDTKGRVDVVYAAPADAGTVEFEAEYAFHRAFSIEIGVPTASRDFTAGTGGLGFEHLHGALKLANYAFEESGVLLGYGLGFELPIGGGHDDATGPDGGHEHGHELYELAPFLNAGLKRGDWELVGFGTFSIPTNHGHQENVGTSFEYNASALHHVSPRIQALVEMNGHAGLSGAAVGEAVSNLTPGLRVLPVADVQLALGLGVSVPLADDRDFDTRTVASVFYHF